VDEARQGHRVGGVWSEADLKAVQLAVSASVEGNDLVGAGDPPVLTAGMTGKLQHPRGDDGPGPGGDHGIGQRVLEEVGLAGGGDPEAEKLGLGQAHTPEHIVFRQVGLLGPEDLGEPSMKGQVPTRPAEEGHRRVAVGIDQTG
jgi:hypothetical protein